MKKLLLFSLLLALVILSAGADIPALAQGGGREDTTAILARLGGYPCPNSDFTCINLTAPLDHFDPASGETMEVVFAVLPASGERKGMFVTVVGGPGGSGLAVADSYTAAFDPRIPEHFDIVFFDQRGVGASGELACPDAAATYYRADWQARTPQQEAALVAAARTFAQDCVREMGLPPERLRFYGTEQAIEDLEAFRAALGDAQFWLYGESYGTQFAQTYAAAHPDRLAGLILDGTVDLTLSGPDYYREQAQAFSDVLAMTLQACDADPDCAADFGGSALAFYDDAAAELASAPAVFRFPLPSGGLSQERAFTLTDLETAAANYLYSEGARMILQRALAAAARNDLVPLARMLYDALSLDPETLAAIPDPTFSDAAFYAVECRDYTFFSGTPDERAEAYLRAGDAVEAALPRLASIFYGDLPCVFWPGGTEDVPRPAPLIAEGIPTLVLGATADPATPVGNGEQVYRRLADGYLVTTEGGAHVIFGRGDACPDDLVTAFLVDDQRPAQRETRCEGVVATPYVPPIPVSAADFADPLDALSWVDDEIYYLPEYYYWDLETPTSVGCPYGGTLSFAPSDVGETLTLDGCAFSAGFVMAGSGTYDYGAGRFSLDVTVTGLANGSLIYTREDDGAIQVKGMYAGQAVDLSS